MRAQVGDAIIYKDQLHLVKNFGLLSTQFARNDGCKVWVRTQPGGPSRLQLCWHRACSYAVRSCEFQANPIAVYFYRDAPVLAV